MTAPQIAFDDYLLIKSHTTGEKLSYPGWKVRDAGVPVGWDVVQDTLHKRYEGHRFDQETLS